MPYSNSLLEEELKNRVRDDYFADFDANSIVGKIDFAVSLPHTEPLLFETEYLLWAEAKQGTKHNIYESLVQLILTIGKARTFDKILPPAFLGAFDAEKIAFIPYNAVLDIFYQNDFNWNVTPSDHTTREFQQVLQKVSKTLEQSMTVFFYDNDDKELRRFIKENFKLGKSSVSKVRINKNNFTAVYQKWLATVKPTIDVNWEQAKKNGIIDADFYLADILSEHNATLLHKLFVLLRSDHYELDRKIDDAGFLSSKSAQFNDKQKAHTLFWNRYERPPRREYWDYIVERRDLLVPQDVRERKGSFFTPAKWVELSQQYLAAELGDNWQDDYYIWDCCAGTGNLEAGLTNKFHIWASTLDKADVDVMHDRIRHMNVASTNDDGANMLDNHVFQFDFLNDPFCLDNPEQSKLPSSLIDVLKDEKKRSKLVIYINPPYAEVSSKRVGADGGKGKPKVNITAVHSKYSKQLGTAGRELYTQFMIRVINELQGSKIGMFSKLKTLQGAAFAQFRQYFDAKLRSLFLTPADTFDNVKGQFPIGFFIWDTNKREPFMSIVADVYNGKAELISRKSISTFSKGEYINSWISKYKKDAEKNAIGFLDGINGNDFQHNNYVYIVNSKSTVANPRGLWINANNLAACSVYFAVRHAIPATWLNDRDQFLYPNDGWERDYEFQTDCLVYTLFNNNIQSEQGINHWIPFTEQEVGAQEVFQSHFMSDYLKGVNSTTTTTSPTLPFPGNPDTSPCCGSQSFVPLNNLSPEAKAVMDAGRALWKYYHQQPNANPNAALYDIRLHFQGSKTTSSGKVQMNTESADPIYTTLITALRTKIKDLAAHIAPKVYDYAFLLK